VFCNDCHSPQASSLSLQGSPPLRHAQLHVHVHSNSRSNSLCPVTYDIPEKYDLAPFKTQNVRIQTTDNETLGAWFTFADPFYAAHKTRLLGAPSANTSSPASIVVSRDDMIRAAVREHPTILYLHGTTGTRAVRMRVDQYQAFTTRLRANVLAPDYRGFADSTGTPSEDGLTIDTRAAWDWLRAHGASPDSVLVVGCSLGTGVAVQFASALEDEASRAEMEARRVHSHVASRDMRIGGGNSSRIRGSAVVSERPRGVVLLSPFSKLETLLDTYYILGLMPLFAPLRTFPSLFNFVKGFIVHRFDSLAKVVALKAPVLIVHAENDGDIPVWHAQLLFDAFLERHLPPVPGISEGMVGTPMGVVGKHVSTLLEERAVRRKELVTMQEMERFGRFQEFSRERGDGKVVFLHTWWGGHDVGLVEGVQDFMGEMFRLG